MSARTEPHILFISYESVLLFLNILIIGLCDSSDN